MDIWSIPNDTELAEVRDILVMNGMFKNQVPEKRLLGIKRKKSDALYLQRKLQRESPDAEFIIEGSTGSYFVSQCWYEPISGSNQDMPDNPDELAEYNQGIADWIEHDQMETLREAFPEEYP